MRCDTIRILGLATGGCVKGKETLSEGKMIRVLARQRTRQAVLLAAALAVMISGLTVLAGAAPGETAFMKDRFEQGGIRTVVAFGDSVTAGYLSPEGWPEILGRRLGARWAGVRVINAGRPGDTSADGLARLQTDVLDRRADLVLVSFGLNDMKKGVAPQIFRRNIERLVDRVRDGGATVALLTTTRMVMGTTVLMGLSPDPYNREIRDIAAARKILLIDLFELTAGQNRKEYYQDLVHPNLKGHELLGDLIARTLLD